MPYRTGVSVVIQAQNKDPVVAANLLAAIMAGLEATGHDDPQLKIGLEQTFGYFEPAPEPVATAEPAAPQLSVALAGPITVSRVSVDATNDGLTIDRLALDPSVVQLLHDGGIFHVRELAEMSDDDLRELAGIKTARIAQIRRALAINDGFKVVDFVTNPRSAAALEQGGVSTMKQLLELTYVELESIDGIGPNRLAEVMAELQAAHLKLNAVRERNDRPLRYITREALEKEGYGRMTINALAAHGLRRHARQLLIENDIKMVWQLEGKTRLGLIAQIGYRFGQKSFDALQSALGEIGFELPANM